MLDNIMDLIAWAIIINAFAGISVFTVSRLLPSFLFSPTYRTPEITDRGIKKFTFPEGRGVLYEPDIKYRRFLKKYLLFEYKGKKYIKCRLSESVISLRYEVAVYDNKSRLIKIIEVAENVPSKCETKNVELPSNASYVSVILKLVNETHAFDTLRSFSMKKIALFSAITTALTVIYGLMVRALLFSIDKLVEGSFSMSIGLNVIFSLIVSAIVILV